MIYNRPFVRTVFGTQIPYDHLSVFDKARIDIVATRDKQISCALTSTALALCLLVFVGPLGLVPCYILYRWTVRKWTALEEEIEDARERIRTSVHTEDCVDSQ